VKRRSNRTASDASATHSRFFFTFEMDAGRFGAAGVVPVSASSISILAYEMLVGAPTHFVQPELRANRQSHDFAGRL
jgi:hypothetical protein